MRYLGRFIYFIIFILLAFIGSRILLYKDTFGSSVRELYIDHFADDKSIQNLMNQNTKRCVFFSGFHMQSLARTVFPEGNFSCIEPNARSVLLVGMHGSYEHIAPSQFQGTVLYVNGESRAHSIERSALYLGPKLPIIPENRTMELFYVSIAFVEIGERLLETRFEQSLKFESRPFFLLYMNRHCVAFREAAFDKLSTIDVAYAGGNCHGTSSKFVQQLTTSGGWVDAFKEFEQFRFGLVMENTVQDGYITEKILSAFSGGTVPIYYGSRQIFDIFNPESFIFFDPEEPQKALSYISFLNTNETAYNEMKSVPIFQEDAIKKYFSLFDHVGEGFLKQKIRSRIGWEELLRVSNSAG